MKATERWFDFEAGDRVEVRFPHDACSLTYDGRLGTVRDPEDGETEGLVAVALDPAEAGEVARFEATELLPE